MIRKKIIIALLSVIFLGANSIQSQEKNFLNKLELDISVSPKTIVASKSFNISSSDLALRYMYTDNLSIGFGATLTNICFSDFSADSYVPFYLSLRYSLIPENKVSPYFLLNLGGSAFQLNDIQYQCRIATGIDFSLVENYSSMFLEIGLGYMSDINFWTPISLGIRF